MLKSREKYHPLYFSAVVGNFYKGRNNHASRYAAQYSRRTDTKSWETATLFVRTISRGNENRKTKNPKDRSLSNNLKNFSFPCIENDLSRFIETYVSFHDFAPVSP